MAFSRDLLRGSLDLMVLSVLSEGRMYGYLIQKRLAQASEAQVSLPAGTLYPVLYRLEKAGAISSAWGDEGGRERRWYELTAKGREMLARQEKEWRSYAACVLGLLRPVDGGAADLDTPPNAEPAT